MRGYDGHPRWGRICILPRIPLPGNHMFFWHALVFLVFTCSASLHDHCMCFSFPWCIGVPHLLNAETSFSPTGNVFSGPVYPLLPAATNPTCHKRAPTACFC